MNMSCDSKQSQPISVHQGAGKYVKLLLILLLCTPFITVFGVYDVVGGLGPVLISVGAIDIKQLGYLYVAYSTLTPVIVLGAGLLIDRFGTIPTAFLALVPMTAGALLLWFSDDRYHFMLAARVLAGFGEAMVIVSQRELAILFTGPWLSFAFAMTNVFGQLGNALVFFVLPILGSANIKMAMGSAFFLVATSIVAMVSFLVITRCYDIKNRVDESEEKTIKCSDIRKFSIVYWCLNVINCLSTCSTFVMMSFGPSYLVSVGYTSEMAGVIIAVMNLLIVVAPVSGWIIDKVGHRAQIWLLCCFLMSFGFMMMAYQLLDPAIWLILIGLSFTVLNSSVNSSVAMVVPDRAMGTAYGLVGVLFAVGLLIYPLVIGNLVSVTSSWFSSLLVFVATNIASFLAAIIIEVKDRTDHYFEEKKKEYEVVYSE